MASKKRPVEQPAIDIDAVLAENEVASVASDAITAAVIEHIAPTAPVVPDLATQLAALSPEQVAALLAQFTAPAAPVAPVVEVSTDQHPGSELSEADHQALLDETLAAGRHPEARYDAIAGWHVDDYRVAGREVFDDVVRNLTTYMRFPEGRSEAYAGTIALYVLHTHVFRHQGVSPALLVTSNTAGAGKSTLLSLLSRMVASPSTEINPTVAVIRSFASEGRTLLLDEWDEQGSSKDMRALLNASYKEGGAVTRMSGKTRVRDLVFAPRVLAGIARESVSNIVSGATLDRCISVDITKARKDDVPPRFRARMISEQLREHIAAWARAAAYDLEYATPDMPALSTPRAAEIWEPLVAVAESISLELGQQARAWCIQIEAGREAPADPNVQFLTDVHAVLEAWRAGLVEAGSDVREIAVDDLVNLRNDLDGRQLTAKVENISFGLRIKRLAGVLSVARKVSGRTVKYYPVLDESGNYLPTWADAFARHLGE